MNLKEFLNEKGIRQVDLVKEVKIDPSRLSLQINGIKSLPRNYQQRLAEVLQISVEKLRSLAGVA